MTMTQVDGLMTDEEYQTQQYLASVIQGLDTTVDANLIAGNVIQYLFRKGWQPPEDALVLDVDHYLGD